MEKRLLLSSPHMSDEGYEKEFVNEAFDTNWLAPLGENVNKFEEELSNYVDASNAALTCSGTAALHLALMSIGVKEGDIVFCSSLTFSATANPIVYQNATPVFIDSEEESWNMSPKALEKAFEKHTPKAVVVVHLYGVPAKIDEIKEICDKHNVPLVEDAAESLGATYNEKHTGTFGEYGIYSFNGNKIITTSGGGMIVNSKKENIEKIKFWATQSRENEKHYEHKEIGYNYRLSNVCAGIGRGQLKVLDDRINKKVWIYNYYKESLKEIKEITMQPFYENSKPTFWLSALILDENSKIKALDIIEKLDENNIEARPIWKPMHMQPVFEGTEYFSATNKSISEDIFKRGVCLPSDSKNTEEDMLRIVNVIKSLF